MLVQHAVRNPDGMGFFEPSRGVVVDLDPADAIDRHDHENDPERQHQLCPMKGEFPQPFQEYIVRRAIFIGLMDRAEIRQAPFRDEHGVSRTEKDGQHPGKHDPDGHENSKHLNRRNRRQSQRGKSCRRRQRGVEHGNVERPHHVGHRRPPIAGLLIALEKLRKDVDGVEHGNRHDENGDHGTHDVDGVAGYNKQAHREDHRYHRDDHRRDDEDQLAEKQQHEQEDRQHGQRRGNGHLFEHLDAENVVSHRQTGNVIFLGALKGGDLGPKRGVDLITQIFGGNGQIEREGFAILRHHGPFKKGDVQGFVAHGEGLFPRAGRAGHQPFETDLAFPTLLDVVDRRRGDDLDHFHTCVRIRFPHVRAGECLGKLGQLIHVGQGFNIEDPIVVVVVYNTHHDDIVQREKFLHTIVEHPHRFRPA